MRTMNRQVWAVLSAAASVLRGRRSSIARSLFAGIAVCGSAVALPLGAPSLAGAQACPNAAFRVGASAALPDCRAYEMVTPPYKEGFPVHFKRVSVDGSSALGESYGVFAPGVRSSLLQGAGEGETEGEAGIYVLSRGASGWSARGLGLPTLYPAEVFITADAGLGGSLWFGQTAAQVEGSPFDGGPGSLYARGANGTVAEVGPLYPPGTDPFSIATSHPGWGVAGVSEDLGHVVLTYHGFYWPGDPTLRGVGSLYEYSGTGDAAPSLLAVRGGRGSREVISRCGTVSDTGNWSTGGIPKLPADGAIVPFTAIGEAGYQNYHVEESLHGRSFATPGVCPAGAAPAVDEVYARVDNGLADAHTVAISEPSREDCGACDIEPGVLENAEFVAVSVDGSKVFFTTTQALLGRDTSRNIYEYDFDAPAGARVVRVSAGDATVSEPVANVQSVVAVSDDGSHVYFTATGVLTATPNSMGQLARGGASNLYLYERDAQYPAGHIAFIVTASLHSIITATATAVERLASVSANGRFLGFVSSSDLTPDDMSVLPQAFEYDAQSGALVRVSIGENGYDDNGNLTSPEGGEGNISLMVADDGAAFFSSVGPLVPQAVSGASNVYEYREGGVYLISDGTDTSGSELADIDPSGADVLFTTLDQLLPQDGDTQEDIYDARVDGGFPLPSAAQSCVADACQGALAGTPALLSPGSELQQGGGVVAGEAPVAPTAAKPTSKRPARKAARGKRRRRRGRASRVGVRARGQRGGGR